MDALRWLASIALLVACGGKVDHGSAWVCGVDPVMKVCICTRPDAGVGPPPQAVARCTGYPCCQATSDQCRCIAQILGQPLEECGLVQFGEVVSACPVP